MVLYELYIENLAVIQKATIPFNGNLNIFTGETGAGKSILINGINAILGQRITKDIVRSGEEKAIVVALFRDIPLAVKEKLIEFGIQTEEDELSISREISADGGSIARINSRTSTVSILREIGELLINIHGQHDSQVLLSVDRHLGILDGFAGNESLISEYRHEFKRLQEMARTIKKLAMDDAEKSDKIDSLTAIIEEIDAVEIDENVDENIDEEFAIANSSEQIIKSLRISHKLLNDSDSEDCVVDNVFAATQELSKHRELLNGLDSICQRLAATKIELIDISEEISALIGKIDIDEERFAYIKDRREELIQIKKRYGPELSDVVECLRTSTLQLEALKASSSEIEKLLKEKQVKIAEVTEMAKNLSMAREQAAQEFVKRVTEELIFLDMPNVRLEVAHQKGKLTINGMDTIEFLISANVGEEPKPIAKIASGGELSRIMLALKNVIADKDNIPTLIFDEIDTGVSGRAAQKIGIKLRQIGKIRQIICVTHLAQIAVMADNHLLIEKKTVENRTITEVKQLNSDGKKYEIARIMGGDNISELMLKNAEELLNFKNTI